MLDDQHLTSLDTIQLSALHTLGRTKSLKACMHRSYQSPMPEDTRIVHWHCMQVNRFIWARTMCLFAKFEMKWKNPFMTATVDNLYHIMSTTKRNHLIKRVSLFNTHPDGCGTAHGTGSVWQDVISQWYVSESIQYSCACHTAFTTACASPRSHVLAESVAKSEQAVNTMHA